MHIILFEILISIKYLSKQTLLKNILVQYVVYIKILFFFFFKSYDKIQLQTLFSHLITVKPLKTGCFTL